MALAGVTARMQAESGSLNMMEGATTVEPCGRTRHLHPDRGCSLMDSGATHNVHDTDSGALPDSWRADIPGVRLGDGTFLPAFGSVLKAFIPPKNVGGADIIRRVVVAPGASKQVWSLGLEVDLHFSKLVDGPEEKQLVLRDGRVIPLRVCEKGLRWLDLEVRPSGEHQAVERMGEKDCLETTCHSVERAASRISDRWERSMLLMQLVGRTQRMAQDEPHDRPHAYDAAEAFIQWAADPPVATFPDGHEEPADGVCQIKTAIWEVEDAGQKYMAIVLEQILTSVLGSAAVAAYTRRMLGTGESYMREMTSDELPLLGAAEGRASGNGRLGSDELAQLSALVDSMAANGGSAVAGSQPSAAEPIGGGTPPGKCVPSGHGGGATPSGLSEQAKRTLSGSTQVPEWNPGGTAPSMDQEVPWRTAMLNEKNRLAARTAGSMSTLKDRLTARDADSGPPLSQKGPWRAAILSEKDRLEQDGWSTWNSVGGARTRSAKASSYGTKPALRVRNGICRFCDCRACFQNDARIDPWEMTKANCSVYGGKEIRPEAGRRDAVQDGCVFLRGTRYFLEQSQGEYDDYPYLKGTASLVRQTVDRMVLKELGGASASEAQQATPPAGMPTRSNPPSPPGSEAGGGDIDTVNTGIESDGEPTVQGVSPKQSQGAASGEEPTAQDAPAGRLPGAETGAVALEQSPATLHGTGGQADADADTERCSHGYLRCDEQLWDTGADVDTCTRRERRGNIRTAIQRLCANDNVVYDSVCVERSLIDLRGLSDARQLTRARENTLPSSPVREEIERLWSHIAPAHGEYASFSERLGEERYDNVRFTERLGEERCDNVRSVRRRTRSSPTEDGMAYQWCYGPLDGSSSSPPAAAPSLATSRTPAAWVPTLTFARSVRGDRRRMSAECKDRDTPEEAA